MRIQLLCDHKWRDLPSLVRLKLLLQGRGHHVVISATKDATNVMRLYRPHCVVFNHLFSKANCSLSHRLREAGVAVILLPTEGAVRPEYEAIAAGEFSDYSGCDLFLNWNSATAKAIRDRWQVSDDASPVVGCTRIDFYSPALSRAIKERQEFCAEYGLDPARPVVTWATQFNYASLDDEPTRQMQFLRETAEFGVAACLTRMGIDVAELPALHVKARAASCDAFFSMVRQRPHIQFILRPHPAEDRTFYLRQIEDLGLSNVRFCPSDYIWNLLAVSDVHLHRHCTTAVEAWLWKIPTIELQTGSDPRIAWGEREAGSDIATTAESLIALVDGYLDGAEITKQQETRRNDHVQEAFGSPDGRRSEDAAEQIDRLLHRRERGRRYFHALRIDQTSWRSVAGSAARYVLGRMATEPLVALGDRTPPADGRGKLVTRRDVRAYERLLDA